MKRSHIQRRHRRRFITTGMVGVALAASAGQNHPSELEPVTRVEPATVNAPTPLGRRLDVFTELIKSASNPTTITEPVLTASASANGLAMAVRGKRIAVGNKPAEIRYADEVQPNASRYNLAMVVGGTTFCNAAVVSITPTHSEIRGIEHCSSAHSSNASVEFRNNQGSITTTNHYTYDRTTRVIDADSFLPRLGISPGEGYQLPPSDYQLEPGQVVSMISRHTRTASRVESTTLIYLGSRVDTADGANKDYYLGDANFVVAGVSGSTVIDPNGQYYIGTESAITVPSSDLYKLDHSLNQRVHPTDYLEIPFGSTGVVVNAFGQR